MPEQPAKWPSRWFAGRRFFEATNCGRRASVGLLAVEQRVEFRLGEYRHAQAFSLG